MLTVAIEKLIWYKVFISLASLPAGVSSGTCKLQMIDAVHVKISENHIAHIFVAAGSSHYSTNVS